MYIELNYIKFAHITPTIQNFYLWYLYQKLIFWTEWMLCGLFREYFSDSIFPKPVFKIFETVKSKILNIAIIYISNFYIQFIILLIECQNFKIVVLLIKAVVHFNFSVQIKIGYFIYSIFSSSCIFSFILCSLIFSISNPACLIPSRFSCSTIRLFSFLK